MSESPKPVRPAPSARARDSLVEARVLMADAAAFFGQDPNVFEMLLYRPKARELENTALGEDVVGSIEDESRALAYEAPLLTRGFRMPLDGPLMVDDLGVDQGLSAEPMNFLVEAGPIPRQSILQYTEYTGPDENELRDVFVFVQSSAPLGQAPAMGHVHTCIPLENREALRRVEKGAKT